MSSSDSVQTKGSSAALGLYQGAHRQAIQQAVAFTLMGLVSVSVIVPAVLLVWFVVSKGLPGITWRFLTAAPEQGMTAGGIYPAILGSLYLVLVTMVLSVPVGILAAVYLTEYARQGSLVRAVRLAIMNLAGIPSIVHGLFGLGLLVMVVMPALIRWLHLTPQQATPSCLLAGAGTLALLVLPMVITTTEEALRQVPQHQRNASLALGATKWQTIRRIVLPNALPGILTGLILAVGRAAGETAPILLTGAVFYATHTPGPTEALLKPFMALPYHLYTISTQLPNAPEPLKWGTALVLLALVLGFNAVAIVLRAYLRRKRN